MIKPALPCLPLPAVVRGGLRVGGFAAACVLLTLHASAAAGDANAAADSSGKKEQVVALTPFEVSASADNTYGVLNSNSVTGFNTQLDKLPLSADIFNQAFMDDVHATTVEQMISTYSAGAGWNTADPGGSASAMQPGDRQGNAASNTLRGLTAPSMLRDSLMPTGVSGASGAQAPGITSNFDIERVEIVNGPQSLLYGGGGAGGVINLVSKQARLDTPASGEVAFSVDQYGHKSSQIDYGMGTDNVAIRFSLLDANLEGRRVNIGSQVSGAYAQIAFKLYNTIVRVSGEHTEVNGTSQDPPTLTAVSAATDVRNASNLHYLMLTNQLGAAANGAASGSGPILNGTLNWNNVDSLAGQWQSSYTTNMFVDLTADTQWAPWLSSQFVVGYSDHYDSNRLPAITLLAPNLASNLTGGWALSGVPADSVETARDKAIRFSFLATNSLFHDSVKSQTILGADFVREDLSVAVYNYFLADANFNPIINTTTPGVNQGRTQITAVQWPINNGLVPYPLWKPRQIQVTYNGQHYVRMLANEVDPNLIGPGNPLGINHTGGVYEFKETLERGFFLTNYSQWMNGKLDTLVGARASNDEAIFYTPAPANLVSVGKVINFSAGADYAVFPWLHPYFTVSDSFDPPIIQDHQPNGDVTQKGSAVGEEAGLKVQNAAGTISGTLAVFHASSKNEEYKVTSVLTLIINPAGLNGHLGTPSNWINVDRETKGLQASVTAAPNANLRIRAGAALTNGTVETTTGYPAEYNDQFHQNSSNQVTYADGTVVYVPAAFNATAPTVSATTPGAQPLTIAMLSDPTSPYYANPNVTTGAIPASSNGGKILTSTDPTHGPILTGAVGLPVSAIQITGVKPAPFIPTSVAGEDTTGYPEISANVTAVYTFHTGMLKGLRIGGSELLGWKMRNYYYYTSTVGVGAPRALYSMPDTTMTNLILGYSHKLGRLTFDTQLNVSNLFNRYHVVLLANAVTGYNTPSGLNATFDQQPRSVTWSNSIKF